MDIKGFERNLGRSAIAIGVAVAIALIGGRLLVARQADTEAQRREEQQVEHGVQGWIDELQARISGETCWDDALQNLGVRYDAGWAKANVGQFFSEMIGVERAYVLNGKDQPIYAMRDGEDKAPSEYTSFAGSASNLVALVRAREASLKPKPGTAPFKTLVSKPIQVTAVRIVDDLPYIVTATLVQPDFGRVPRPARAPIVVTGEALDGNFVEAFANRFLLKDLHIHPMGGLAAEANEAHVVLRDATGRPVARMDWSPQQPGMRLLWRTTPVVAVILALLSGWAYSLFIRGRKAAEGLQASESRSVHMALHDSLTGLPNRAYFYDRVAHAMAAMRRDGLPIGVLTLDLDRFKEVNDTLGHAAGDEMIIEAAARLKSICRTTDTVVRLGGDEFAILQPAADPQGLAALSQRILTVLSGPLELAAGKVFMSVSVGATLIVDPQTEAGEALRQADLAMYRAKEAGRDRFCFFEPEMDLALKARKSLEHDLRAALDEGALTMVYQPQVDGQRRITGVEALVRWNHPTRGPVSPAFFVPIAEDCGLIGDLGAFTLRRAFKDSLRWPHLTVAVNVSAVQLRAEGFAQEVAAILKESGADPSRIELEITEGVLLADDQAVHQTLKTLRAMGFTFALDDFGTGYSSLSYLRRYPVDKIKIDRSFVINIGAERDAEAVVGAIVRLAKALNLKVIAEGVETDEQRLGLRRAGCALIQGYLYSKPVTADAIESLIALRSPFGLEQAAA